MRLESTPSLQPYSALLAWVCVGLCAPACTLKERILGSPLTATWDASYIDDGGTEYDLPHDECAEDDADPVYCGILEYYLVVERNLKGELVESHTQEGMETGLMGVPFRARVNRAGEYQLKMDFNGGNLDSDLLCVLEESHLFCVSDDEYGDFHLELTKDGDE